MFTYTYIASVLSTIFIVTAFIFLIKGKRTAFELTLVSYLVTAAIWIGSNAIADVSYTAPVLILASQMAFFGAITNLFCFLLLVDLTIDERFPSWRRLFFYGIPCLVLALSGFSSYGIIDVAFPLGEPAQIVPGPIYSFGFLLDLAGLTYGAVRLWRELSQEKNHARRMQLLYILAGLLLTLGGQTFFDALLPLMGEVRLYILGPLMSVFFAAGCAYSITKHNLLDIRVVAQRGLVYAALLAGLVGTYVLLIVFIGSFIGITGNGNIFLSAGLTVVLGVFSVPIIERYFRTLTDRLFFKDTYSYADALHSLSDILRTYVLFEDLVHHSEERLKALLRASAVRISLQEQSGTTHEEYAALQVPIELDGTQVGCIHLAEKRSGDPYTPEDVQLLHTFAYQAATALSRAQLYAEAQKHAAELEAKVTERTQELSLTHERERQMLNELSHNLQTPITILQTKLERLTPHLRTHEEVRSLEQSLQGFSGLVYELLGLARLESGNVPFTKESFDISALLQDIAEEVAVIATEQGVTVTTNIEPSRIYVGDERRLREVCMNLANNALRYMREDSLQTLSFVLSATDTHTTIRISDTGRGISDEDLPYIFDRFYRGKDVRDNTTGTGLGLAIVKRIVEEHGGSIVAESTVGVGTSIKIVLPN